MSDAAIVVSVIIPTHNRCALLRRLLDSLARQTLDPSQFEVIIVHNHTDDGSEEMARAWCDAQAFKARYFRKNYPGPARSRQFGAQTASGRIFAYIDDDCIATPGWLAAGVAACDAPQPEGVRLGLVQGCTLPVPDQPQKFPCKTVTVDGPTVFFETCNIFYHRHAYEAVGGFSQDFLDLFYGEDSDLGWKVTQSGYRAGFCKEALIHHEVFRVSFYKWLAEPLFFKNLPYLVKKHPALRQHMFCRYFLTRETFLFNTFLGALIVLPFHPLGGALATLPYFVARFLSGGHVGGVAQRAARVVLGVPRGLFTWWALCKGSLRARSFLL